MPKQTIISADGTALAARWSGSGSPVVLVHGAMGNIKDFAFVEKLLAEHYTVWVYSRRGRGGSGDHADYGLQREIDDVLAVIDAAGDRPHLVGHSGGASYALLAARDRPLRSLVLYEPPLHLDRVAPDLLEAIERALGADDPDRALEVFLSASGIGDQERLTLRSLTKIWDVLRAGVGLYPREHRALQAHGRTQLAAAGAPDVPTLYMYGEESKAPQFPSPEEVAALFPRARTHCLRGQRHLATMFAATEFADAVRAFTAAYDQQAT